MSKIFTVQINNETQQCTLLDISKESNVMGYICLKPQDGHYLAVYNSLAIEEREEFELAVANQHVYYQLSPIDYYFTIHDVLDRPDTAENFMQNGKPTLYAESIFHHLFYHATDKKTLCKKMENGELCYSIFPASDKQIADHATPLFNFPREIRDKIKSACKKIWWSAFLNNLYDGCAALLQSSANEIISPYSILLALATFAVAQHTTPLHANDNAIQQHTNTDSIQDNAYCANQQSSILQQYPYPPLDDMELRKLYIFRALQTDNVNQFEYILQEGYRDEVFYRDEAGSYFMTMTTKFNCFNILSYVANVLRMDLNQFQVQDKGSTYPMVSVSWIYLALANKNYALANKLVELKVDVNYLFTDKRHKHKYSLLHYVLKDENIDMAKRVVRLGADIFLVTGGITPFHTAAINNNKEMLEYFLRIKGEKQIKSLDTLLIVAAQHSSPDIVELLLQNSWDPNSYIENPMNLQRTISSPVLAIIERGDVSLFALFDRYGLKLDPDSSACQVTMLSAMNHTSQQVGIEMVYALTKRGADFELFAKSYYALSPEEYRLRQKQFVTMYATIAEWRRYRKELAGNKDYAHIESLEIPDYLAYCKEHYNEPAFRKQFPSLNTEEERNNYFLHSITMNSMGALEYFKHAIFEGYDIFKLNKEGFYTIIRTALLNNAEVIRYMAKTLRLDLNQFQADIADTYDTMPLSVRSMHLSDRSWIRAAQLFKHDALAAELVELGVNINHIFNQTHKFSLLHLLVAEPFPAIDAIKKVIKLGADVNNYNLLSIVLQHSSTEVTEIFLQNGFNPNLGIKEYEYGITETMPPVHFAVEHGNITHIRLLGKYGLNLEWSPKLCAAFFRKALKNEDVEMALLFVKYGADVNLFLKNANPVLTLKEKKYLIALRELVNSWINFKKDFQHKRAAIKHEFNLDMETLEIPEYVHFAQHYFDMKSGLIANNDIQVIDALNKIKALPSMKNQNFLVDEMIKKRQTLFSWPETTRDYVLYAIILAIFAKMTHLTYQYYSWLVGFGRPEVETQEKPVRKVKKPKLHITKDETQPDNSEQAGSQINILLAMEINSKLTEIRQTINSVLEEKNLSGEHSDNLLFLRNRKNSCFNQYKIIEVDEHCRSLKIQLNKKISELHKYLKSITSEEISHAAGIAEKNKLSTYLEELEIHKQYFENCQLQLSGDDPVKISNSCDTRYYQHMLDNIKKARHTIISHGKEIEYLEKQVVEIERQITKAMQNPEVISPKPVFQYISHKKKEEKTEKVKSVRTNTNNDNNINKAKEKEKNIIPIKMKTKYLDILELGTPVLRKSINFCMLAPEQIKNDTCVMQVNQLFRSLEVMIKDQDHSAEWKKDATHYLLMKSALLIADLLRDKKIHIYQSDSNDEKNIMYLLRTNIVHYPELCFSDDEKMFVFVDKYYETFNEPLQQLNKQGECKMIILDDLQQISPSAFTENRPNHRSISTSELNAMCRADIKMLVNKCASYYEQANILNIKDEYSEQGMLHYAMYGVILHLRNKINFLEAVNYGLYKSLSIYLPDVVLKGNQLAHKINEGDMHVKIVNGIIWYGEKSVDLLNLMKTIDTNKDIILKQCAESNIQCHASLFIMPIVDANAKQAEGEELSVVNNKK